MPVERELKLVAPREDLRRLASSPAIERRALGPLRTDQLESVYFDTKDRRLAARALALRVRRVNGRYVQTLKHGAGVVRGEWEMAHDSGTPAPHHLFAMAGVDGLDAIGAGDLEPVLVTQVERQVREVRLDGSGDGPHRVELALDIGGLMADERRAEIAELELELLEGEAHVLYDFALELSEQAPLRVETLSKAARGDLLRSGAPPTTHKAFRVELDPDGTVDDAMAAILGACYAQWLQNQAAALDGRDSEGVHQLRVALRRLRSVFTLFKQALPPAELASLKSEVRSVLQCLGRARDLDVLVEQLVCPVRRRHPDDPALEVLEGALEAARARAYDDEVRPGLTAASYTRLVLTLGGWIARRGWRADGEVALVQNQAIGAFASELLDQRLKTVKKRGRHFEQMSPEERHRLRIAIKKLRYALDFCRSLFPKKPVKAMLATLSELQDHLGAANDLAVAERRLEELGSRRRGAEAKAQARAAGFILGWHDALAGEAERELGKLWRHLTQQAPAWGDG